MSRRLIELHICEQQRVFASFQVETTNRFTSLVSKPVLPNSVPGHENELSAGQNTGGSSSGLTTPRKRSSIHGTDRQTFHKLFQAALKSNQLSSEGAGGGGGANGTSGGSGAAGSYGAAGRTASPCPQQQEREVYQNERGDVIWLELQAS